MVIETLVLAAISTFIVEIYPTWIEAIREGAVG